MQMQLTGTEDPKGNFDGGALHFGVHADEWHLAIQYIVAVINMMIHLCR
jgi:hypothetical protein